LVQVNKKISLLHRSRIDIMANILQEANKGAKKTHVMYRCNLSFRQLNAYLEFLVEMGFLETITMKTENKEDAQLFKTTRKGRDLVEAYHNLKALLVA
jgi:predicted transcriptional regulator